MTACRQCGARTTAAADYCPDCTERYATTCRACERLGSRGPCFKHHPDYQPTASTRPLAPTVPTTEQPRTARPWGIAAVVLFVVAMVIRNEPVQSTVSLLMTDLCIIGALVCAGVALVRARNKT